MGISTATLTTNLNNNKDRYLDLTHQLNNYNEIYNVNFYLDNLNSVEYDKLDRANNNIKAKVLRMKQEYMTLDYSENENKTRSNIMYFSILVTSVLFIIAVMFTKNMISMNKLITISLSIIIVYFGILLFILYNQANRRKYAWNQYYWPEVKK